MTTAHASFRSSASLLALGHPWPRLAYQTYGIKVGNRWSPSSGRQPARPVLRHRPRHDRRHVAAVPRRRRPRIRHVAGRGTASVSAQFVGFTSAEPGRRGHQNTLGFLSRPDLDRVLGSTSFLFDDATGEILEADIFFNSAFPWSVSSSGETGKFDLESIILHETGHLFGLGHSALGETELHRRRRPPRHRRRRGDVPDRVLARQRQGPHAVAPTTSPGCRRSTRGRASTTETRAASPAG